VEQGPCHAPSGCDHQSDLLLNLDASVTVFQMMTHSEATKQQTMLTSLSPIKIPPKDFCQYATHITLYYKHHIKYCE